MARAMTNPFFRACILLPILAVASAAALAGTLNYEYDALGRLQAVQHADGSVVSYALDAAGNRTEVAARSPPGIPASITVPASSTTGSFTVNWGVASGTVTAYELYEATNAGFSGETLVHNGSARTKAISGKGNGSYYYRVRACNVAACGLFRTGGNATIVTVPPGVPASITVPVSSTTGSYTIGWGNSTGTVTAYQLYEATNSGFTGQVQVYTGTGTSHGISGKANGTYYYRVRACNGAQCSGYLTGANSIFVGQIPAAPGSLSGPATNTTGNYSISWSAVSGATRYELWETLTGGSAVKVHDGTATSKTFSNKPDGVYKYQAKACNVAGCSGYSTAKFVQVCRGVCNLSVPEE